jgi:AcrR family transcriptional regulator
MSSQTPLTGAQERRDRNRADAKRAILDAAESLLDEGGLGALSMRRLADRCGYTAPTLYHYFPDKPGLIHALIEEWLATLALELRAIEPAEDPVETTRALAAAFANLGIRNPSHYQLLVSRPEDTPDPPSLEEVQAIFGEPLDLLVASGRIAEDDVERLRQGLWCLLHGFILLQTTRPAGDWVPGLLDHALDAMLRGSLRRHIDDDTQNNTRMRPNGDA